MPNNVDFALQLDAPGVMLLRGQCRVRSEPGAQK